MRDGHTGISNRYGETKKRGSFDLTLSYLKEKDTGGYFVMHVVPTTFVLSFGLDSIDFLKMLGFTKSSVNCQAFGKPCYYKYMFEREINGWGDDRAVDFAHQTFNHFTDSIDEIYSAAQRVTQLVGEHVNIFPWAERFDTTPKVLDLAQVEPGWLAGWRVDEHREVLDTLEKARRKAAHFRTIQYCLWGTGDDLVDSVRYILSKLQLDARKTKKGATVDLILDYSPQDVEIGIEVTGLSGNIDKASPKMNQAFTYLQECQDDCKALIVANTHNNTPLTERTELLDFTEPAVKVMTGMGIVGLTSMDLYRIWQDVGSGDADIHTILTAICDHEGGVYKYPS